MQVSTDIDNEGKWKECFVVTGIKLPIGYYIGATAATGELAGRWGQCVNIHLHTAHGHVFYPLFLVRGSPP